MYRWVELEELNNHLDYTKLVAFDTETDNPETGGFYGNIEVAQFYQEGWDQVLMVRRPEPFALSILLKKLILVGHTIHYDFSTLQDQLGVGWQPGNFKDVFYAARLYYPEKDGYSLDKVLTYVLGYDPYLKAGLVKRDEQKSNWAGLLTEDQELYAALDVKYLLDVWTKVEGMKESFSYKLDILFTKYCLKFQLNGMPVDQEKLRAKWASNNEIIAEANLPINVNSWQQVRPYIGEDSSDALALATYTLAGNTKAKQVNRVRKTIKQNSFLKKFETPSGRIYGKFLPSARSGRCTSKDQNLQQLPRKLKDVFGVSPESGKILTTADYAQLEMRGGCVITNEKRMEKLFRVKEDLHSYVAKMLFGNSFTKTQRQIAKTCNFNLLYGGGAAMLGSILIKDADILLPDTELYSIRAKWLRLWPAINAWQEAGKSAWRKGEIWSTPLGRKYKGKLMTDQLNLQVQGFGAEVAKLATHYMMPEIDKIDAEIICDDFIHDNWIFEHDDDEALCRELSIIVANSMQEAWFECSKATRIKDLPMPIEVFSGYNWGDIEDDKFKYSYTQE